MMAILGTADVAIELQHLPRSGAPLELSGALKPRVDEPPAPHRVAQHFAQRLRKTALVVRVRQQRGLANDFRNRAAIGRVRWPGW